MPNSLLTHFSTRYIDKTFWAIFIMLIVFATIALSSATSTLVYSTGSALGPVLKQIIWFLIGILIAYCMQYAPSNYIRMGGYVLLGISVLCLYLVIIPHSPFTSRINDASRWFKLGPISFQPSEPAKLSLIVVVADLLSRVKTEDDKRKYFYITLGVTGVTVLPILLGNLSTAVLLAGIVFLLWIIARIPWKYWVLTAVICLSTLVAGYFLVEYAFIKPHRPLPSMISRASTWVSRVDDLIEERKTPKEDTFTITDENRQRNVAKIAIARGSKTPFGVLPGNSKERDYLPLAFADYIFAIIVEESGIVGAAFLIFLYLAILFRACWTSSGYEDFASIYMVMGLALMLTIQAMVSMMVAVGIGPVTGQPLPLFSRGGTSVIITSMYFGIMMAVSREQASRKGDEDDVVRTSMEEMPDIDSDIVIE